MKLIIKDFRGLQSHIAAYDDQGNQLPLTVVPTDENLRTFEINVHEPDMIDDIAEFHKKFGLAYDGPPRTLPADVGDFRERFMKEELTEYQLHANEARDELTRSPMFRDAANYTYHLEEQLDALVDEIYVVLGTAHLQGFTDAFREAWRRVHAANMSKVRAERAEDSKRGSTFDVIKPPGWEPPSHTDLVEVNDLTITIGRAAE